MVLEPIGPKIKTRETQIVDMSGNFKYIPTFNFRDSSYNWVNWLGESN